VDDLIQKITEKFGIDADKAKGIVGTVGEFLSDKLPGPIGGQVSKLLGGGDDDDSAEGDDGGGLLGKAKGLLGG